MKTTPCKRYNNHTTGAALRLLCLAFALTAVSRAFADPPCERDPMFSLPHLQPCGIHYASNIPLILVHGNNNEDKPSARWGTLLQYIAAHPTDFQRFNVYIWYHDTSKPIGFNCAIGSNARELHDEVLNTSSLTGRPLLFIAHSRGGLVCRAFMNYQDNMARTIGLITLGTPHHGSPLAVPDWVALKFFSDIQPAWGSFLTQSLFNQWVCATCDTLDTTRTGTLDLAWDNTDIAVSDFAPFLFPVSIANMGFLQLTANDCGTFAALGAPDASVFWPTNHKAQYGVLAEMNSNNEPQAIRDRLICYAAFDGYQGDNTPWLQTALTNGLGLLFLTEHQKLALSSLILSGMRIAGTNGSHAANDGLVSIQSALYLKGLDSAPLLSSASSANVVNLNYSAIESRFQTLGHRIYTGGIEDHLDLLDANINVHSYHWENIATDVNLLYNTWDTQTPTITSFLLNGGTPTVVGGSVTLSAHASDDRGVVGLEFAASSDGAVWSPPIPATPTGNNTWSASWNTVATAYEPDVRVRAIAVDIVGNQSVAMTRMVTIDNRTQNLSVTPSTLNFGDVVVGASLARDISISLVGGASSSNWQIATSAPWISFNSSSGGVLLPGQTAGRTITIDTTQLSAGAHSGTVSLTSGAGNIAVSVSVQVASFAGDNNTRYADADAYIRTDTQQVWGATHDGLGVGWTTGGGYYRSFIRFPLGPQIEGQYIVGGSLGLYLYSFDGTNSTSVRLYKVLAPWTEGSSYTTLNGLPMQLIDGMDFVVGGQQGWYNLNVNDAFRQVIQSWADNPSTNYGIALVFEWGSQGQSKYFISRHYSDAQYRPRLLVGYAPFLDNDGPVVAVTSHADGQHVTTSSITISGSAYDPSGVQQVQMNDLNAGGPGNPSVNWSRARTLQHGPNTITIWAQDDSPWSNESTRSIVVHYDIPDYALTGPSSQVSLHQGETSDQGISVGSIDGFASPVTLSIHGLPSGVTATFTSNPVIPSGSGTLVLEANLTAPPGTHPVTITGTSGSLSHSLNFDVAVLERPRVTLTTSVVPAGTGTVGILPSGGTYDVNTIVTVHAAQSPGFVFDQWSVSAGIGVGNTSAPVSTCDADVSKIITARFVPRGDMNGNGSVDSEDNPLFLEALLGSEGGTRIRADINEDGSIDGLDIQPFVNCLVNPCVPPSITQQPAGPLQVCVGGQATFSVAASGTGLTYQWKKDGNDFPGPTSNTLTISPVQQSDAGAYTVVVSGTCGSPVTSDPATLMVNTPPLITVQPPPSQTVAASQAASFNVTATGIPAPTFQWRKAGVNLTDGGSISGATTSTLTINPVQASDVGNYDVVATNTCGLVASSSALLVVNQCSTFSWHLQQPTGPIATYAHALAYDGQSHNVVLFGGRAGSGNVPSSNQMWTWNGSAWQDKASSVPVGLSARDGHGMVFTPNGVILFGGISWPSNMFLNDLWEWNGSNWQSRTPNPIPSNWPSERSGFGIAFDSANSQTVLYGGSSASSDFQDTWLWNGSTWSQGLQTAPPGLGTRYLTAMAYDAQRQRVVLFGGLNGATVKGDTWEWNGASSTWSLRATSGPPARHGHVMAYDDRAGQVLLFGGYSGSSYLDDMWYWDGVNSTWTAVTLPQLSPRPDPRNRAAGAFDTTRSALVLFGGQNGTSSSNETWEYKCEDCIPASISIPPAPQAVCVGGTVTFTVSATGTGLTYQWKKDGVDLSGETGPTLTFDSAQVGDAGSYTVVVSGACGDPATSNPPANLIVNTSPSVSDPQPSTQTVSVGDIASFNVTATGNPVPAIQWRKNGVPLVDGGRVSGVTTSTLSISLVAAGDAGTYDVVVTNLCNPPATSIAATLNVCDPQNISQTEELVAVGLASNDHFGGGVSVSGPVIVIGAPGHDQPASNAGSAYVYRLQGASWIPEIQVFAADGGLGDQFGHSVSVFGDRMAVGAFNDDGGSVYFYRYSGGSWNQEGSKLTGANRFGWSVALGTDWAVAGAYYPSSGAFALQRNGATWQQTQALTPTDLDSSDTYGYSSAIDGATIVVGAPGHDHLASNAGSAFVFSYAVGQWTQTAELLASDGGAEDGLGTSVAIDGDFIVVGASGHDLPFSNSGAVYVFTRSGASWSQTQKLSAPDAAAGDSFGASVSISGGHILVGADQDDYAGTDSGSTYVFQLNGGNWNFATKITSTNAVSQDRFGLTCALDAGTVVVGAEHKNSARGSVYIFDGLCGP